MRSYRLSVQNICDELQDIWTEISLSGNADLPLRGVRFFKSGSAILPGYLFISSDNTSVPADPEGEAAFLFCGKEMPSLPQGCAGLLLPENADPVEVFTRVQEIFEKYLIWERRIRHALQQDAPLDEMLEAAMELLNNPIYLHDAEFYILSSPGNHPDLPQWERDPGTGRLITPSTLLDDFRADPEYWETLNSTDASIYPGDKGAHHYLYYNLWNHGVYIGRLCVEDIQSALRPGHSRILTWLGDFIVESVQSYQLLWLGETNLVQDTFRRFLAGESSDTTVILNVLRYLGWEQSDMFLCLHLVVDLHRTQTLSAASTIGHISSVLPDSVAFLNQNGITVVVDMTRSGKRIADIVSTLAILLREGLFKMGVSSGFRDISRLTQAFYQARKALELGTRSRDTRWYFRFEDYLLDYILQTSAQSLSPDFLASQKLLILRDYDRKNMTDFYQTLRVYLDLERNALQTAEALFIHRSTLFYRLGRIKKIADVDLDNARERITLQLSFYILEQNL